VITCRERHGLTERAIESIVDSIRMPARVIYVDVGTPERLRARIDARAAEWHLDVIRFDDGLWPGQARRRIAGSIDTKYAVFMDNDVRVLPGWLERMVECAEQTGAGMVGPLYLWGTDERSDRIHMAGGELKSTGEPGGIVLTERHRLFDKRLDEVELKRESCDFLEYHCMLMRREVFQATDVFSEEIVCVHEHIHAALVCREMGYAIYLEPSARVVYLAFAPYALSDLDLFRWRWSIEAGDSSLKAFAKRWGVIDDARSFGVRSFLVRHRSQTDPIRPSLQGENHAIAPMRAGDLEQTIAGLLERALARGYSANDLKQIKKAHWTALVLSSGGYRPCGRPFINHLIGTASVLVHFGFETRIIVGALLHAAYTHAPRMSGGPHVTVDTVAKMLGGVDAPIERAVRAYSLRLARWTTLSTLDNWQDLATIDDVDVALIAMANLVDMRLSGEVRMTGRIDDDDLAAVAKADEICAVVGVPGLSETLRIEDEGPQIGIFDDDKRPQASFRLEGPRMMPMANPAFFEVQRSIAVKDRPAVEMVG
jgi:glycosyltransferase involved in cell wall biosynthesis